MNKMFLVLFAVLCFAVGTTVFAAVSGVGSVASQVTSNIGNLARLITATSYVAGMAFAVGAIVKFKAHKDNPTQIPISAPIFMLFVAAALLFIPMIFAVSGATLFGQSGYTTAGPSGIKSFGAKVASG